MNLELLQLLLLIIIANGTPILIQVSLNKKYDFPIDCTKHFVDTRRILGDSKTWRGALGACVVTSICSWLMGYAPEIGLLIATYAVLGDLASSFIKRRLGMQQSAMAPLLDQVPESLFPAVMMKATFGLDILSLILVTIAFIIIELALSQALYKWGIRKTPY
jgi:CDP-2,3-bis-(O-geranylgeranyl)-sn-glycerol synthase